jgi:hypothetical protein
MTRKNESQPLQNGRSQTALPEQLTHLCHSCRAEEFIGPDCFYIFDLRWSKFGKERCNSLFQIGQGVGRRSLVRWMGGLSNKVIYDILEMLE